MLKPTANGFLAIARHLLVPHSEWETHQAFRLALSSSVRSELPQIIHKTNVDATERLYVSSSRQLSRTITSGNVTKTHINLSKQLRAYHTDFIND